MTATFIIAGIAFFLTLLALRIEREDLERQSREEQNRPQNQEDLRMLSIMDDFYEGETHIGADVAGVENRPAQYQTMASLLAPGDSLTLRLDRKEENVGKALVVLVDGIYPIGFVSELQARIIKRNFHLIDDVKVMHRSDDFPPKILIEVDFFAPME